MLPEKPADLTGKNCPTVQNNRYTRDDHSFSSYQTYALIHEFMHFYLQSHSLTGVTHPCEQYGLNGCVGLKPLHALHNPSSYQNYVASKLPMNNDISNGKKRPRVWRFYSAVETFFANPC